MVTCLPITMLQKLKAFFRRAPNGAVPARIPAGERVYAMGDIHGRCDLFTVLIDAIEADDAAAPLAQTTVILLGDLVDRGADSAGVVALAREWQQQRAVRILGGNHEEMFLKSFESLDMLRHFLRHGGRETLLSYGIERKAYQNATIEEVQAMMSAAVSPEERTYIAAFEEMVSIGDYLFVHAGIDPAIPIAEQTPQDLRWIREPFLSHPDSHGPVVVHGHTITEEPEDYGNRIGIDTGAYNTGRLTVLVLEGAQRRYISAFADDDGAITIRHDPPGSGPKAA